MAFMVITLWSVLSTMAHAQNMCPDIPSCYCYHSSDDVRADCTETTLTFIPEDFPWNTTQIIISRSLIKTLLSGNLSMYSQLNHLNLQQNDMVEIKVGAFNGIELLQDLYLASNLLTEIKPGTFAELALLSRVYLNTNKLASMPPFTEVTTLTLVNLDNNEITSVPTNAFGTNTELTSISLSYNKITTIATDAFNNLNNLENLFLDDNKIQALGEGTLNGLSGLITLSLMNNELVSLTGNPFKGTGEKLQMLLLANNDISAVDTNVFVGLVNLEILQLENNLLTAVPSAAIKQIQTLRTLDLSANLLDKIEDYAFSDMPALSALNIGLMNTLTNITQNAFSGTTNLTQLSLYSNKWLTVLEPEWFPDNEHKALVIFKIYDNGFTHLKEELFSTKESLQRVDLFWNPFHCDCLLKWMPKAVLDDVNWAKHWDDEIPLLCESPGHLQTFEIPRMRPNDFTCSQPEIEFSTPQTVVAYLHGNATLQTLGHNGIPETWWITPSGEYYVPLRLVPPEYLTTQRIKVTEHFERTDEENVVVATLEFSNTTLADAGVYKMWASNHVGNVSVDIILEVLPYELTPEPPSSTPVSAATSTTFSIQQYTVYYILLIQSGIFCWNFGLYTSN